MSKLVLHRLRKSWVYACVGRQVDGIAELIEKHGQTIKFMHIGADQSNKGMLYAVFKGPELGTLPLTIDDLENLSRRLAKGDVDPAATANLRRQLAYAVPDYEAHEKETRFIAKRPARFVDNVLAIRG